MKKILLFALLLLPYVVFPQTLKPINQVLGIKFGTSKSATLAAIKAKGGVLNTVSKNGTYIFNNIKFGGRKTTNMAAFFSQGKFYSAIMLFKADSYPQTIDYYNDLVTNINSLYGTGQETKNFSSGFADGDGNELTAIQEGHADYKTLWHDDDNDIITVAIDKSLIIELVYESEALSRSARAKQDAEEKADY